MKTINFRIPETFEPYSGDALMSNFDHVVNKEVEAAIKNKPVFSEYPAYNFFGKVWFQGVKWHC